MNIQRKLSLLVVAVALYFAACAALATNFGSMPLAIGGKTIHAQSPEALSAAQSWVDCVADGLCRERAK